MRAVPAAGNLYSDCREGHLPGVGYDRVTVLARNQSQARSLPSPGVDFTVMLLMVQPVVLVFALMQRWFIRGAVEDLGF